MPNCRGMVDTSDEWIVQRTGIQRAAHRGRGRDHLRHGHRRRRAPRSPPPASMPSRSISIVLATSTPDNTFPASAVSVQAGLGITHGAAFDLQAVCSGFVFCARDRRRPVRTGAFKRALVIGVGDLLAHPRLERPHHLRAVRRRRRRGRGGGAAAAWHARGPRHSHLAPALGRPLQAPSSTSTAARPRPAPSGICAWRAARSSSTRWR